MLDIRGQQLLGTAVALCAAGLILSLPGALTVGCILLAGLLLELRRLRAGLAPLTPPWDVRAHLAPRFGEASVASLTVRTHRVAKPVSLQLDLETSATFAGVTLWVDGWETTAGLDVSYNHGPVAITASGVHLQLTVQARSAAVHRVHGLRGRLSDAMGLLSAPVFLPCPCEIAALPRSLHLDLSRLTETRRRAARSAAGMRPDNVAGHGDELRELREHVWGDPFKHIAWKASARRGRLMTRSFEKERSRALYVVLDTGASMRNGRLGDGPLDQALDMVHSLAELAARSNLPFGASLVDGRVTGRVAVREGLAAMQQTDRALLDVRRTVAEDLAPLSDDGLLNIVAAYLRAVESVDLRPPRDGNDDYARFRQRTVMAALARLPERERLPAIRGPEPSRRADLSILRRFCRSMDLALPYRDALPAKHRSEGMAAGVQAAMSARNGPFVIVIISDFRGLRGANDPLFSAMARARRKGHRLLVVAVRDVETTEPLDYVSDAEDVDTARGLARADKAARTQLLAELEDGCRRVGATMLADPTPQRLVAQWAMAQV